MNDLDELEAEAIFILRETAAQFKKPVLLFSGGKDSLCLLYLSLKAFRPDPFPFPVLHIDTGHNFPETLTFRDEVMRTLGEKLLVRKVLDTINAGRAEEATGPYPSRNRQQAQTLKDAIAEEKFDAVIGGARRDEEKARAKEKFFSPRLEGWDPTHQRQEFWRTLNGILPDKSHMRVFPLSNWTESDVWRWLQRESVPVPSLYFSHEREIVRKSDGSYLPMSEYVTPGPADKVESHFVRFRTVGDMTCTSPVFSPALTIADILVQNQKSKTSERGTRADDRFSPSAMEDRKREGYF